MVKTNAEYQRKYRERKKEKERLEYLETVRPGPRNRLGIVFKNSAERQRNYRERKKAEKELEYPEKARFRQRDTGIVFKSNAEKQRDYRERKKAAKELEYLEKARFRQRDTSKLIEMKSPTKSPRQRRTCFACGKSYAYGSLWQHKQTCKVLLQKQCQNEISNQLSNASTEIAIEIKKSPKKRRNCLHCGKNLAYGSYWQHKRFCKVLKQKICQKENSNQACGSTEQGIPTPPPPLAMSSTGAPAVYIPMESSGFNTNSKASPAIGFTFSQDGLPTIKSVHNFTSGVIHTYRVESLKPLSEDRNNIAIHATQKTQKTNVFGCSCPITQPCVQCLLKFQKVASWEQAMCAPSPNVSVSSLYHPMDMVDPTLLPPPPPYVPREEYAEMMKNQFDSSYFTGDKSQQGNAGVSHVEREKEVPQKEQSITAKSSGQNVSKKTSSNKYTIIGESPITDSFVKEITRPSFSGNLLSPEALYTEKRSENHANATNQFFPESNLSNKNIRNDQLPALGLIKQEITQDSFSVRPLTSETLPTEAESATRANPSKEISQTGNLVNKPISSDLTQMKSSIKNEITPNSFFDNVLSPSLESLVPKKKSINQAKFSSETSQKNGPSNKINDDLSRIQPLVTKEKSPVSISRNISSSGTLNVDNRSINQAQDSNNGVYVIGNVVALSSLIKSVTSSNQQTIAKVSQKDCMNKQSNEVLKKVDSDKQISNPLSIDGITASFQNARNEKLRIDQKIHENKTKDDNTSTPSTCNIAPLEKPCNGSITSAKNENTAKKNNLSLKYANTKVKYFTSSAPCTTTMNDLSTISNPLITTQKNLVRAIDVKDSSYYNKGKKFGSDMVSLKRPLYASPVYTRDKGSSEESITSTVENLPSSYEESMSGGRCVVEEKVKMSKSDHMQASQPQSMPGIKTVESTINGLQCETHQNDSLECTERMSSSGKSTPTPVITNTSEYMEIDFLLCTENFGDNVEKNSSSICTNASTVNHSEQLKEPKSLDVLATPNSDIIAEKSDSGSGFEVSFVNESDGDIQFVREHCDTPPAALASSKSEDKLLQCKQLLNRMIDNSIECKRLLNKMVDNSIAEKVSANVPESEVTSMHNQTKSLPKKRVSSKQMYSVGYLNDDAIPIHHSFISLPSHTRKENECENSKPADSRVIKKNSNLDNPRVVVKDILEYPYELCSSNIGDFEKLSSPIDVNSSISDKPRFALKEILKYRYKLRDSKIGDYENPYRPIDINKLGNPSIASKNVLEYPYEFSSSNFVDSEKLSSPIDINEVLMGSDMFKPSVIVQDIMETSHKASSLKQKDFSMLRFRKIDDTCAPYPSTAPINPQKLIFKHPKFKTSSYLKRTIMQLEDKRRLLNQSSELLAQKLVKKKNAKSLLAPKLVKKKNAKLISRKSMNIPQINDMKLHQLRKVCASLKKK